MPNTPAAPAPDPAQPAADKHPLALPPPSRRQPTLEEENAEGIDTGFYQPTAPTPFYRA